MWKVGTADEEKGQQWSPVTSEEGFKNYLAGDPDENGEEGVVV